MSYIPGTEYRMIPKTAPSASHGRNYNMFHQQRPTLEKEYKRFGMLNAASETVKQLNTSIALRQSFLDQQTAMNVRNEYDRLQGRLMMHRDPLLRDGRFKSHFEGLEKKLDSYKSKAIPIIGAESRYLY